LLKKVFCSKKGDWRSEEIGSDDKKKGVNQNGNKTDGGGDDGMKKPLFHEMNRRV
jgi:hypothetical protein